MTIDRCKFESSLKEECRALSADSSKAYSKPTALIVRERHAFLFFLFHHELDGALYRVHVEEKNLTSLISL